MAKSVNRQPKPVNISNDAIKTGTMFGYWRVEDPEIWRSPMMEGISAHDAPRPAFLKCHCTRCDNTTKYVRLTYLKTGKSTSCCKRGFSRPACEKAE
jgi:hypothetical protein